MVLMRKTLFTEVFKMSRNMRFALKIVAFLVLIVTVLNITNTVLCPKYFYNQDWPTTSTFAGFYDMEENSIDVLFFGSSHCVSAFSPQEIYENYGLRSYNLASEQQNMLVSYYWLKEALRFQTPKVVVVDTYFAFPFMGGSYALNSDEPTIRKAIDAMHWSRVKVDAVHDICEYDSQQSKMSYYFKNIRFHTRWLGLNEEDFTYPEMYAHTELKGYSMLSNHGNNETYIPFEKGSSDSYLYMEPLMQLYLDKIVETCKENNIKLILVKTPTTDGIIERYNTTCEYALQNGIEYYDFNEKELYDEISYDYAADNQDDSHANLWGGKKISNYIAKLILEKYNVEPVEDKQWEDCREFYAHAIKNAELKYVKNLNEYFSELLDDKYTVFIALQGDNTIISNDKVQQQLEHIGVSRKLLDQSQDSFYAVISENGVKEAASCEMLNYTESFREGRSNYSIISAGSGCGNIGSIVIDGVEYSLNQPGLNVVIYDNIYRKVIDSVCFNGFEGTRAEDLLSAM